jgi:hypothetical protein
MLDAAIMVALIDEREVIQRICGTSGFGRSGAGLLRHRPSAPFFEDPFPDYDTEPVIAYGHGSDDGLTLSKSGTSFAREELLVQATCRLSFAPSDGWMPHRRNGVAEDPGTAPAISAGIDSKYSLISLSKVSVGC